MQAYHDEEWGVPERDSRALWEKLQLDGCVPLSDATPAGGDSRNAMATGRRVSPSAVVSCFSTAATSIMTYQVYARTASIHSRRLLINQMREARLTSSRVSTRSCI